MKIDLRDANAQPNFQTDNKREIRASDMQIVRTDHAIHVLGGKDELVLDPHMSRYELAGIMTAVFESGFFNISNGLAALGDLERRIDEARFVNERGMVMSAILTAVWDKAAKLDLKAGDYMGANQVRLELPGANGWMLSVTGNFVPLGEEAERSTPFNEPEVLLGITTPLVGRVTTLVVTSSDPESAKGVHFAGAGENGRTIDAADFRRVLAKFHASPEIREEVKEMIASLVEVVPVLGEIRWDH
jgi:hypothetical protein